MSTRWPAVFLVLVLLAFFVGGLIPGHLNSAIKQTLDLPFPLPPVAHVVASFCLVVSLAWWRPAASLPGIMGLVVVLGGAAEVLQTWVPGRQPSWSDMGLNLAGTVVGGGLMRLHAIRTATSV